jgi:hypothetical protein
MLLEPDQAAFVAPLAVIIQPSVLDDGRLLNCD